MTTATWTVLSGVALMAVLGLVRWNVRRKRNVSHTPDDSRTGGDTHA